MKMPELTHYQVMKILDKCYNEAVNGLAKSKNCVDLAAEYLNRYPNTEIAVRTMINNQIAMCTTSGFLTSLGVCLTGTSMSKICRDAGVQFGNKLTLSFVNKIPG